MKADRFSMAEHDRRLGNLLRWGRIVEVDHAKGLCRALTGELPTPWLPWFVSRAGNDRTWWAPEPGEQCLILSESGEIGNGVVMVGVYSEAFAAPASDGDIHRTVYGDGAVFEYNRATHSALLDLSVPEGSVTVKAKDITLDAMDLDGTIELRAKNIIVKTGDGGFYHQDHYGRASRITHEGGSVFKSETWTDGSTAPADPDHGFSPPEVETPE